MPVMALPKDNTMAAVAQSHCRMCSTECVPQCIGVYHRGTWKRGLHVVSSAAAVVVNARYTAAPRDNVELEVQDEQAEQYASTWHNPCQPRAPLLLVLTPW